MRVLLYRPARHNHLPFTRRPWVKSVINWRTQITGATIREVFAKTWNEVNAHDYNLINSPDISGRRIRTCINTHWRSKCSTAPEMMEELTGIVRVLLTNIPLDQDNLSLLDAFAEKYPGWMAPTIMSHIVCNIASENLADTEKLKLLATLSAEGVLKALANNSVLVSEELCEHCVRHGGAATIRLLSRLDLESGDREYLIRLAIANTKPETLDFLIPPDLKTEIELNCGDRSEEVLAELANCWKKLPGCIVEDVDAFFLRGPGSLLTRMTIQAHGYLFKESKHDPVAEQLDNLFDSLTNILLHSKYPATSGRLERIKKVIQRIESIADPQIADTRKFNHFAGLLAQAQYDPAVRDGARVILDDLTLLDIKSSAICYNIAELLLCQPGFEQLSSLVPLIKGLDEAERQSLAEWLSSSGLVHKDIFQALGIDDEVIYRNILLKGDCRWREPAPVELDTMRFYCEKWANDNRWDLFFPTIKMLFGHGDLDWSQTWLPQALDMALQNNPEGLKQLTEDLTNDLSLEVVIPYILGAFKVVANHQLRNLLFLYPYLTKWSVWPLMRLTRLIYFNGLGEVTKLELDDFAKEGLAPVYNALMDVQSDFPEMAAAIKRCLDHFKLPLLIKKIRRPHGAEDCALRLMEMQTAMCQISLPLLISYLKGGDIEGQYKVLGQMAMTIFDLSIDFQSKNALLSLLPIRSEEPYHPNDNALFPGLSHIFSSFNPELDLYQDMEQLLISQPEENQALIIKQFFDLFGSFKTRNRELTRLVFSHWISILASLANPEEVVNALPALGRDVKVALCGQMALETLRNVGSGKERMERLNNSVLNHLRLNLDTWVTDSQWQVLTEEWPAPESLITFGLQEREIRQVNFLPVSAQKMMRSLGTLLRRKPRQQKSRDKLATLWLEAAMRGKQQIQDLRNTSPICVELLAKFPEDITQKWLDGFNITGPELSEYLIAADHHIEDVRGRALQLFANANIVTFPKQADFNKWLNQFLHSNKTRDRQTSVWQYGVLKALEGSKYEELETLLSKIKGRGNALGLFSQEQWKGVLECIEQLQALLNTSKFERAKDLEAILLSDPQDIWTTVGTESLGSCQNVTKLNRNNIAILETGLNPLKSVLAARNQQTLAKEARAISKLAIDDAGNPALLFEPVYACTGAVQPMNIGFAITLAAAYHLSRQLGIPLLTGSQVTTLMTAWVPTARTHAFERSLTVFNAYDVDYEDTGRKGLQEKSTTTIEAPHLFRVTF